MAARTAPPYRERALFEFVEHNSLAQDIDEDEFSLGELVVDLSRTARDQPRPASI
ncbi:hypothetical protein predicted by Glimmer/Critica (plasmid) [Sinorhizobium fredii HH103]|uniref:Uncharacterized protein n=1 Tax=Sinorhizobium fredii (strain USDA 257) TaxID=1185652 RepID=I3XH23_SINF2|nr:hypothetical protein USDA257_p04640 [Sinorhizobium fredii USDA 257]CCE99318.1 hypothetical protein SFHH103_04851 [Sinorhizobium fredii HH103]CEO91684.1 hypothetical protein predicted by Glimmer/Critica [Sinorhizobium fredii HH103]